MNYYAALLGPEGFGTYEVDWSQPQLGLTRAMRAPDVVLVPAFIDIHIHGAYGIDFMSATSNDMLVLGRKLRKVGYEALLPTTVASSVEDVLLALANLPDDPMFPGFHLEGPFLSPKHPGAQPVEAIEDVPMTPSRWDPVLNDLRLRVITVAPELTFALELSSHLNARGVLVSMGHSDATFEQARRGFEFGFSSITHTFNAMRGFHHREPGLAGYALWNDNVYSELIYDRVHVSKEAAGLFFKCKPDERVIAVSDSSPATGLSYGTKLTMWGHEVVKGRNDVRIAETDTLAGSTITLQDAFHNLYEDFGPEVAIRATSINPRRALRMPDEPKLYLEFNKKLELIGSRERELDGVYRSAYLD